MLKRKIALLLAFTLTFSNVIPALATESPVSTETVQSPVSEETAEEQEEKAENRENGDTADDGKDGTGNELSGDSAKKEADEAEASANAAEDEAGNEEAVSGNAAETVSVNEDAESPAGVAPEGTPVEDDQIPRFWQTEPQDAAEWYTTGENNYNVYFKDSAFIGYYQEYFPAPTDAKITIYLAENAAEDTSVIVQGGQYGEGTSVSVDSSLSENTYVAHGSIVEREDDFIQVKGLDEKTGIDLNDDYEKDDENTVIYKSGWRVYNRQESQITIYFNYMQIAYWPGVEHKIYMAGNKNDPIVTLPKVNYWEGGTVWTSEGIEDMRSRTKSASADFVVKSDGGVSWYHVDKCADVPDTSKLDLTMVSYNNMPENWGYYGYSPSEYYGITVKSKNYYPDVLMTVSSDYMSQGNQVQYVYNGSFDFSARQLGAQGCDYNLYVRGTSSNAFPSDWVKYDKAAPVYLSLRAPSKKDAPEIVLSDNAVILEQNNPDYSYYWDKRGYSRLKFLVAESGTPLKTVSETGVENWKGKLYDDGNKIIISQNVSKNGSLKSIVSGNKLDIYAAWFLPKIQYDGSGAFIQDFSGMGEMSGTPVKLYSVTYTKDGTILFPEITYTGKSMDGKTIRRTYPGEDEPLYSDKEIERYFNVRTLDSSGQSNVPGELILKAISVNDPRKEEFLAQDTLSAGSIGRDVTEEGGWEVGDYYLMAYFKPDDTDTFMDAIKQFDLKVIPIELATESKLGPRENYPVNYLPKGYEIRYEDISTKLYTTEWVYDEQYDYDYEKKTEDPEHKVKDAVYLVHLVSGNKQWRYDEETGDYIYEYPYEEYYVLSGNGQKITLDKEGEFKVMLYNILDGTVTDNDGNADGRYTGRFGAYDYWCEDYTTDVEEIKENERYGYGSYNTYSWWITIMDPGSITMASRGNELPYGVANQLRNDVIDKYGQAFNYRRTQMDRVVHVYSNGVDVVSGDGIDRRLKNFVDYIYSTSETGTYDTIDKLSKEDLELGKTIWVKAVVMGDRVSNAVSLKIGKQPINIAAVCPTASDPGEKLIGTYMDDIYVYYLNPYPNENPRELRTNLTEWSDSDRALIDLTGIDKDKEGTQKKTSLAIKLNDTKTTHYELRSTAAIYVVRSAGAIAPKSGGAINVDEDKKTEVKKTEIRHEMYTVQFIDAKTGEKLADSMAWDKEKGLPSNISLNLKKSNFGVWSLGSDCSDRKTDITIEGIVTNQGNLYSFDLEETMTLLKGQGVSVITFYGYETEKVNKHIKINEIAPVSFNGLAHVSTEDKGKGKSPDLFVSVQLETDEGIIRLAEGSDYSLKYDKNKNAGKATVTVIGKGVYKGLSSKREFVINPADITKASVIVNPSYKFGNKGISVTPKVSLDGKTLKNGSNKDYVFELVEEDKSKVTGTFDKNSASHKFRIKVTGNNDYSGTVYSEPFWGVPSSLKALNVTLGATTAAYDNNRTFVTAADYFNGSSKVSNYDGSVSAQLYDLDYRPLEKGEDTGVSYYVGVRAADADAAIAKGISPAVTYKKVRFTGLKFNKTMFELSSTAFEFSNSNNAIKVKAKSGASVSWADIQVTFSDYYAPDGDEDLPFAKGAMEPEANDGKGAHILDNLYPGTYSVYLTGTGRYCGSFKLTYKVNPMKAVVGNNMDIIVNGGNNVYYNAAGYDAASAPVLIVIKGTGKNPDTVLKNVDFMPSYGIKSSVNAGGNVTIGSVYTIGGTKVFKNSVSKRFGISACDLKAAMSISGNDNGAVKKTTVNLGAKVPVLTLFQYGPAGIKAIANGEFQTEDIKAKAAANPNSAFDLEVTPRDINYTGGKFTVSGVDAYESSYTKARLKMTPGNKAEAEGGAYEKKNKNGNLYFKYTGKAVEPGVIIKDKQGNEISEEFYDVTYENNVMYSTAKSPAKAIVEFKRSAKTGQFPYGGSAEVKFYIVTDYSAK